MTARHPVVRYAQIGMGGMMIAVSPLASPLPVPAGIALFAGGMMLVLRNSRRARVRFARAKRRWPRAGRLVDRAMRRRSALRRLARDRVTAAGEAPH